jgi:hypothetical protein
LLELIGIFNDKNSRVRKETANWLFTIWNVFVADPDKDPKLQEEFFENLVASYQAKAFSNSQLADEYFAVIYNIQVLIKFS